MSGKGFAFKGKAKKVELAPEAFRDLPKPQEEELDTKPSEMTTAIRAMFSRPKAEPKTAVTKPTVAKAPKEPKPTVVKESKPKEPKAVATSFEGNEVLKILGELIRDEETQDIYAENAPEGFEAPKVQVPESRRGFSEFIKEAQEPFMLPSLADTVPVEPGEKYLYQKFIREYMRQASPYRGVLVQHGLGSGKTCTAIATSEALFATSNKKIIVMTPFSLRKNFLEEVTFCGFRHQRLQNYWTPLEASDPTHRLFAKEILNLSEAQLNKAKSIWVPELGRDASESNQETLDPADQTEIRKQILSQLVWDPVKNPTGRIRFINYNGITATKLKQIACTEPETNFFDDAVVVVDEVHNLVRLMQGTIEPYLTEVKGLRRKVPREEVTVEKWRPSLCSTSKNQKRGQTLYRLLLDAKNTKIVGLSGTPLINFPEELAILMNLLHGQIPVIEGVVSESGQAIEAALEAVALEHPFLDFVRVRPDPTGGGTRLLATLLPQGVKKIANDVGVVRIPEGEAIPNVDAILDSLKEALRAKGLELRGEVTRRATPVLPPFGQDFRDRFLEKDGVTLRNQIVLLKRITGLISQYRGSRQDLMPRVKVDEVVRVPFSSQAQRVQSSEREAEIESEMKKTKKGTAVGLDAIWSEVQEIQGAKASSNYKMASRQACNFAFPRQVVRPRPGNVQELELEAGPDQEILDTAPTEEPALVEDFPEIPEDEGEDAAAAEAEDEMIEKEEGEEAMEGGADEEGEEAPAAPTPATVPPTVSSTAPTTVRRTLKQMMAEKAAQLTSDCKAGQKPGESQKQAIDRAKDCLRNLAMDQMKLEGDDGLANYSAKQAAMLERIEALPGSSLVQSQFLEMEGIGIFRIAMEANGQAPIQIVSTPTGLSFSKKTEMSLRKGPGQKRQMTFSGAEDEEVRRNALHLFNARFSKLPEGLQSISVPQPSGESVRIPLETLFSEGNLHGELCRVFCITSAGAEGLSLKNVRGVHIMEPYWNDVRLKQVKGRAIRIGSHLDLPEEERDVSIQTQISCFSREAQLQKAGEGRIDETIRLADSLERKEALKANLPIPEAAMTQVMTSDERIHVISERKKAVMEALEGIMKSAAVDCELNVKQNKDGTFKCLPLKGKVGDFLQHPDVDTDIVESASMQDVAAPTAKKAAVEGFKVQLRGKPQIAVADRDSVGTIAGFKLQDPADTERATLLGTTGVAAGKPAAPVKVF